MGDAAREAVGAGRAGEGAAWAPGIAQAPGCGSTAPPLCPWCRPPAGVWSAGWGWAWGLRIRAAASNSAPGWCPTSNQPGMERTPTHPPAAAARTKILRSPRRAFCVSGVTAYLDAWVKPGLLPSMLQGKEVSRAKSCVAGDPASAHSPVRARSMPSRPGQRACSRQERPGGTPSFLVAVHILQAPGEVQDCTVDLRRGARAGRSRTKVERRAGTGKACARQQERRGSAHAKHCSPPRRAAPRCFAALQSAA